jgi:hypothetical protein
MSLLLNDTLVSSSESSCRSQMSIGLSKLSNESWSLIDK